VLNGRQAIRYKVAVGKRQKSWTGQAQITAKYIKPDWSPSPEVRRDFPHLPAVIRGGAPNNPMGIAAMTLSNGNYAIHGTNRPGSIGRAVSYGCIRMANHDIQDLFRRVQVRTPVIALP
jgi:lipoprotein-anchoring transpeptidase ErfK/SrfK